MDRINEIFMVSQSILDKEYLLINSPMYSESLTMRNMLCKDIKNLIMKENELISSLTLNEINAYLVNFILLEQDEVTPLIARLRNKFTDAREIIHGRIISGEELGVSNIPDNMRLSISEVVLSMIDIEVIKRVSDKINSLLTTSNSDMRFVGELRYNLKRSRSEFLFTSTTAEMLAIEKGVNIDRVPTIDINRINNKINLLSDNDKKVRKTVSDCLVNYAKGVVNILGNTYEIENNPNDIFEYLVAITQIEVLLNYMDKETLLIFSDFCDNYDEVNTPGMEDVKRLVREKNNSIN